MRIRPTAKQPVPPDAQARRNVAVPVSTAVARRTPLPVLKPSALDYAGVPLPDLSPARAWAPGSKGLDGSTANRTVTETYTRLDAGMSRYLGEPAAANWMSFGKYASREAGGQILRMEEVLKICYRLDADSLVDSLQDLVKQPQLLGEQGMALLARSKGNPIEFVRNTKRMHDALVFGNTGVFADIAPAYDTFLRAEAKGQDGLAALRRAGYGQAPKDAQGFVYQAFECYDRARKLGDRAAKATGPEREALLARRLEAVNRGNLLIGIHEQMVVIQGPRVFGDPAVYQLLEALSDTMVMTDANGVHELLPNGGNWADFATRMGFSEVPALSVSDAFVVKDHQGKTHHYVLHPDAAKREGTIGQYFADDLSGDRAKNMIANVPSELPSSYRDGNDMWAWTKRLATAPWRFVEGLLGREDAQLA
ncbi:MAG: hypothetical protein ACK46X_04855 [Candidatus Sericytochromatia bacterium]